MCWLCFIKLQLELGRWNQNLISQRRSHSPEQFALEMEQSGGTVRSYLLGCAPL